MPTIVGPCVNAQGSSHRMRNGTEYFDTVTLASLQPKPLPLWKDHNPALPAGQVVYLEHDPQRGTWLVATVDQPIDDDDDRRYFSVGMSRDQISAVEHAHPLFGVLRADDAVLREVSMVANPGAPLMPFTYVGRTLDPYNAGGWPTSMPSYHRGVLDRATDYLASHRHARSLEVQYFGNTEIERLADDHLAETTRRQRRDENLIEAHERAAAHLAAKFTRQGFEVPPELVTNGRVHTRRNVGHVISVR